MSPLLRWRILPLLMVFVALSHFNRISISVAGADAIIPSGLLSECQMGVVYTAYLVPYAMLMMAGGWLIDCRGPRFAWIVVGFGSAVFVALTGEIGLLSQGATALWCGLLLVRAWLGAVSAPLHPTAATLVGRWLPPSAASLANGLVNCAALLGIAATYETFGQLMDRFGWPGAFLVSAAVTLGLALLWTILASDYPPELARPHQSKVFPDPFMSHAPTWGTLLGSRSLLCLTLSYGLVGYFQYLFFYWVQYYFNTIQRIPTEMARRYSTFLSLAMGAGMVLGGCLSDLVHFWLGPRRGLALVPILGLLGSAVAVVLGLLAPDPQTILICFLLAMAGTGMSEGSYWTVAVRLGGLRAGAASAILNTGGNVGGLLAPVLTPLISSLLGWQAGLGVASLVCLGGAALWLAINPTDHVVGQAFQPDLRR